MIWIVRVALERPYTFIVMSLLILIIGPMAAIETPTDIFPNIGIPVIGVAWQYTGLPPDEMAGRILTPYERVLSTTVNDIEHIESTSLPGIGIVKIYFQPERRHPHGDGAGHLDFADHPEADAARHHAAAHPQLQRLDRSDHAARELEHRSVGAAGARPDAEFHAPVADDRAGRRDSLFLWRPGAPDADRSRSAGAAVQRPVGAGRRERHRHPEPDHPGRQRQDRSAASTRCSSTTPPRPSRT